MTAKLRLAILSLWLGAMLMFSVGVAPAAFSVLKNEQRKAGDIVNLALGGTESAGIGIGLALLLLLFFEQRRTRQTFQARSRAARADDVGNAALEIRRLGPTPHYARTTRRSVCKRSRASDPARTRFQSTPSIFCPG
jgi:hypothetical protein